ncbi:hypothetical protein [Frisingicoccus sp.]|uniref:hypothetical protein n=1 Tax=Frisingicoccus sp. TaxID=1918627 RepID=UPI003AB5C8F6
MTNYIAMIGKKERRPKMWLLWRTIGFKGPAAWANTCWVALTYSKIKTAFLWMREKSFVSSLLWVMVKIRERNVSQKLLLNIILKLAREKIILCGLEVLFSGL